MFIPPPGKPEGNAQYGSEATLAYAVKLLRDGATSGQIIQKLKKLGLNEQEAAKALAAVSSAHQQADTQESDADSSLEELEKKVRREAGQRIMMMGVMIFLGGLVATVGTYFLATEMGMGIHVVAWGAIIVGLVQILRGAQMS